MTTCAAETPSYHLPCSAPHLMSEPVHIAETIVENGPGYGRPGMSNMEAGLLGGGVGFLGGMILGEEL